MENPYIVTEKNDSELTKHEEQFQVADILSGRMCLELDGKLEYLDILGYNYYYNNQWSIIRMNFCIGK